MSKSQQREKKKVQKRQAREESKDKEGLIFPPEKSELFTECSRNGLNFPKKSENGLNFPKKSESAEEGLKLPAKCCADSVPKPVSDADEIITETSPYSFGNFRKLSLYNCFISI